MKGRILKSTGSFYKVIVEDKILDLKLGGRLRLEELKHTNPVSVGDEVLISEEGLIIDILPRKNYLIRKSTNLSKQTHIVASNIDQLWIVATLRNPRTSTGFINRILVTAEAYDIPAGILYNKKDLLQDGDWEDAKYLADVFSSLGYPTYFISSFNEDDITFLRNQLKDKTSLFTGHSGVGKSSLLNALDPSLKLRTGEISKKFNKGKHTTTFAEMHRLSFGGYVIDTPGIKEFGLVNMEKTEIGSYFPEILKIKTKCKFNNCLHINEPGCAVIEAVEQGAIAGFRYLDYVNMIESNEEYF
ncbi:MAG: ribosome small subunit-dependent GTPase A [Flavobacteriales bacterium]|nr:ribosome small subunit-dependent GTPase A [Flavobacteriales bacterium]